MPEESTAAEESEIQSVHGGGAKVSRDQPCDCQAQPVPGVVGACSLLNQSFWALQRHLEVHL